jgi:hypothetical protein
VLCLEKGIKLEHSKSCGSREPLKPVWYDLWTSSLSRVGGCVQRLRVPKCCKVNCGKKDTGQKPARAAFECVSEIHKNGRRKIDAPIRGCSRYDPRLGDYEARRMEERVLTVTKCHVPASER